MEEKSFKTVVVPHVDGDAPSWYDPYWSPEEAVVYISGKPKILADVSTLSRARSNVGNNLEAFYSELSGFVVNSERVEDDMFPKNISEADPGGVNLGSNVKFGFLGSKKPQQVSQGFPGANPSEERQVRQPLPPTIGVDFSVDGAKFKIQCFYHEILFSAPYLILVFNTDCVGFPKFFPDPGVVLSVTIPKFGVKDLALVPTGIRFVHNSNEYYVLVDYSSIQSPALDSAVSSEENTENDLTQSED